MTAAVGSYTPRTQSWFTSTPTTPPKSSRPRVKRGEIVHPVFEEIARVTDDPYWNDYFMKFARGVFFKSLSFDGRTLTFSKRAAGAMKPVAELTLPPDPREASVILRRFLIEHTHKSSERDRARMCAEAQSAQTKTCSAAKRKQQLQEQIDCFIYRLAAYMQLTSEQRSNLSTVLHAAFLLKYLTAHDVHFNESGITTIDGLHYDQARGQFYLDPARIRLPSRSSSKSTRRSRATLAQECWFEFLDSIRHAQRDSSVIDLSGRPPATRAGEGVSATSPEGVSYTPSAD